MHKPTQFMSTLCSYLPCMWIQTENRLLNRKAGAVGYFSLSRRGSDSQLPGERSLLKSICVYQTWRMLLQVPSYPCLVMENTAVVSLGKNAELRCLERKWVWISNTDLWSSHNCCFSFTLEITSMAEAQRSPSQGLDPTARTVVEVAIKNSSNHYLITTFVKSKDHSENKVVVIHICAQQ